ncbi:MAG: hypothetical protein ACUVT7_02105 [Thermoplasmata archaeon]
MDPEHLDILREALSIRQRKEEFERAIGRAVRRRNLDFRTYVQVVGELREKARENDLGLDEMARRLLDDQNKGPEQDDEQDHAEDEHQ